MSFTSRSAATQGARLATPHMR